MIKMNNGKIKTEQNKGCGCHNQYADIKYGYKYSYHSTVIINR